MRKHPEHLILSVKKDRLNGSSILELVDRYSLPKTTIWHYIKELVLSDEQATLLRSRQGGSAIRSKDKWRLARESAVGFLRGVDLRAGWTILIAALYWAEGTKYSGFVFTNTDEFMIKIFLGILRQHLAVKDDEIDVLIRTSGNMDPQICRRYWSNVTAIPYKRVRINYNAKQNKSKSIHGMCRLTIRKGGDRLKLMHCLIDEITVKILGSSAPVVQGIELRTPNAGT